MTPEQFYQCVIWLLFLIIAALPRTGGIEAGLDRIANQLEAHNRREDLR